MRTPKDAAGFSLVEVLVALVIGAFLLVATGNLGLAVFHQRASYDSISAATSLAEKRFEILRDQQNPVSTLTSGTANGLKEDGTAGGPFNVSWTVSDALPSAIAIAMNTQTPGACPTPVSGTITSGMKKISITVTHTNNPAVNVNLVTYYKVC